MKLFVTTVTLLALSLLTFGCGEPDAGSLCKTIVNKHSGMTTDRCEGMIGNVLFDEAKFSKVDRAVHIACFKDADGGPEVDACLATLRETVKDNEEEEEE